MRKFVLIKKCISNDYWETFIEISNERYWRHDQAKDVLLKICKKVRFQVENQPLYGHGVMPNGDPQGSEKSTTADSESEVEKEHGVDSECW